MASRDDRMLENEKLFRSANERLRERIEDVVPSSEPVPFVCECLDELCLERVEMTLDTYHRLRSNPGAFAVAPGHAAPRGEVVVEDHGDFQVVQKEAA